MKNATQTKPIQSINHNLNHITVHKNPTLHRAIHSLSKAPYKQNPNKLLLVNIASPNREIESKLDQLPNYKNIFQQNGSKIHLTTHTPSQAIPRFLRPVANKLVAFFNKEPKFLSVNLSSSIPIEINQALKKNGLEFNKHFHTKNNRLSIFLCSTSDQPTTLQIDLDLDQTPETQVQKLNSFLKAKQLYFKEQL